MSSNINFAELGVNPALLPNLTLLGYTNPSEVQKQSIPILLKKTDLIAQAQTGTGKTAAFALPILTNLNLKKRHTQALILTPTRELSLQVSQAFQSYGKNLTDLTVLAIYGGQDFRPQLKALQKGAQIVVGTPGRVMDHLRRGTLVMDQLTTLVLDEADEMLKMGFIDDVQWILEQIPNSHQTALFSATMPPSIQKIAEQHLKNPSKVHILPAEKTVANTQQFHTLVTSSDKLELLTRFLETEEIDAAIIFTRTKSGSAEVADKLIARGFSASAMNGDMNQSSREKTIARLKDKSLDFIVATEVAARGLDVERISHVINYDIPSDSESYVHRIGRTGRAGRNGTALSFVTPHEKHLLKNIERMIRKEIQAIKPPSELQIKQTRLNKLTGKLIKILENNKHHLFLEMAEKLASHNEFSTVEIIAALISLSEKDKPIGKINIPNFISDISKNRKDKFSKKFPKKHRPSSKFVNKKNRK